MVTAHHKTGARVLGMVWPALALLLLIACWIFTLANIRDIQSSAEESARKDAALYARAYEQYVTRSVAQMDQVSMQLQQSWEQSHGQLSLDALYRAGMFTDQAFISVSIAERDGSIRNATRLQAVPRHFNQSEAFQFHQNNNSTAMRISVATEQNSAIQDAIEFTRRLEGPDDSFAGVLILTIDASYFTAFYNDRLLGRDGMVALLGESGTLRLERHGDGSRSHDEASLLLGQLGFSEAEGVRALDGDTFSDGQARLMGWRKSPAYPLVAYVGLSQHELSQAAEQSRRSSLQNATLASVLLVGLGWWGYVLAHRSLRREREEEEVRRAYRTATESANDGFYMAAAVRDSAGQIVDFEVIDCNERGAQMYGLSRSELVGRPLRTLATGVTGEELLPAYLAAMESGFYEDDRQLPALDGGKPRWGHRRLVRVGNGLAITLQDISERKLHEQELERLAHADALTQLPNRYWLNAYLPGALAEAAAARATLALLFIDLDEFKQINDTQGHTTGDVLLQQAAARLGSLMRQGDQVVRFGGDEFIVLLSGMENERQIEAVAERILNAISQPFVIGGETLKVGASIGISVFPRDGEDPESLIKHGDIAMYAGKSEGKGQYRFFDPVLYSQIKSRAQLKHSLERALERHELQLHFQPRVDTATGQLCSMEALLRWQHPERGLIPPLEFIPLAETSGLIFQIGERVMALACAQLAGWRAQGLPLVPVSINVSPRQFAQGGIHRQLALHLERYQLDARLLEVEITESAMMGEQDEVIAELSAIRALGIKLHVDDFGTGYSSLSQLQKLKMDVLKVDKAFTAQLSATGEGRIFFQAIISMAHALGMAVVAEGVETAAQRDILREMGCNEIQGYFISRPLQAAQMAEVLAGRVVLGVR